MHRIIMDAEKGEEIDHRDGNGLNNQRCNLRLCTHRQNLMNRRKTHKRCSSKFRGVSWEKRSGKWCAQIMIHYRHIHLGYFDDEVLAALAYNEAATKHFGEFAHLNEIDEDYCDIGRARVAALRVVVL